MSTREQIFDRLLEVAFLIQQDLASSLPAAGLTTARAHLLWELDRLGPSTQQALAAALEVSPRNVTGLVDAVEAAGFVQRRPHPNDRRATLVTLTDRGSQTLLKMKRDREEAAAQLMGDLDQEQVHQFGRSLDGIADRLRALAQTADTRPGGTA